MKTINEDNKWRQLMKTINFYICNSYWAQPTAAERAPAAQGWLTPEDVFPDHSRKALELLESHVSRRNKRYIIQYKLRPVGRRNCLFYSKTILKLKYPPWRMTLSALADDSIRHGGQYSDQYKSEKKKHSMELSWPVESSDPSNGVTRLVRTSD